MFATVLEDVVNNVKFNVEDFKEDTNTYIGEVIVTMYDNVTTVSKVEKTLESVPRLLDKIESSRVEVRYIKSSYCIDIFNSYMSQCCADTTPSCQENKKLYNDNHCCKRMLLHHGM